MKNSLILALSLLGSVAAAQHGFVTNAVETVPELNARLVRLTYAKNGAEVVWLDRADDNMTFAIGFATPPEDDTGVAHVLEHSVLCGSARFPVKEPFVDLLKGSLATYLNAWTFPDKTVYPVASRNAKDFLNLTEVYLDAVFRPHCATKPEILAQEGWHYEYDGTNLTRSGVVYSEMKGSFANPDRIADLALDRLLFPDTTYGHCSGGDPAHIPELTFEKFAAFHRRHYHPSNARVFLDGRLDLDAVLALLDRYFRDYAPSARVAIPRQKPVSGAASVPYASPDEKDRTILFDGWVVGSYDEVEKLVALDVISDILADSNEAPLKKAILDAHLAEDVWAGVNRGQLQPAFLISVRNTSTNRAAACRRVIRETLADLCRKGLDADRLAARLDHLEYSLRERDSGTTPLGIELVGSVLGPWLYGGDPALNLRVASVFASLREKLGTGYYERCLKEAVLDGAHRAEVTLVPSATLAAERRAAETRELAHLRDELGVDALAKITADARALKARQSAPDRPEDLAKLPRLTLADVPEKGWTPQMTVAAEKGVTVLRPRVDAPGIVHFNLAFSLAGLSDAELFDVPLLARVLGELPTAFHSALDLRRVLDARLGRFSVTPESYATGPHLVVRLSTLAEHRREALSLVNEILMKTKFDAAEDVLEHRAQMRTDFENAVASDGRAYAVRHAASACAPRNRRAEIFDGLAQLRHLQNGACGDLAALAGRIFTRERLTVAVTDDRPVSEISDFLPSERQRCSHRSRPDAEPSADPKLAEPAGTGPLPSEKTRAFSIPAHIGFAAAVGTLPTNAPYAGAQRVASRYLSYGYLWDRVRVKGGAYGVRAGVSPFGLVTFWSYRDPDPARAFAAFGETAAALRTYADEGAPGLARYQVSTLGEIDPYRSPRTEADTAVTMHFERRTADDLARLRREVLATKPADLAAYADALEAIVPGATRCVIAGEELCRAADVGPTESVVARPAAAE